MRPSTATPPTRNFRLITCGGSFARRSGHHTDNIVVFATLVTT